MTHSPNHEARAALAWPVLIRLAAQHSTISYSELGKAIGGVHQRAIRYTLGPIQDYCLQEKLPPLTIVVVQAAHGRPGSGFIAWDVDDMTTGLEQVYSHAWSSLPNPFGYATDSKITQEILAGELVDDPERARDVYSLVRVRGIAQAVFRLALIKAYGCACAFCGTTFPDALEAAHIVPWQHCSSAERMDPRNGVLLCATHHSLFDAGFLWIDEKLCIRHRDNQYSLDEYSQSDRWLTLRLNRMPLRGPEEARLRPHAQYIARRAKLSESR